MTTLKTRLEGDLRTAMKARDDLVMSTLRMALTAVRTAEVAGTESRVLSDDEVLGVLGREARKRREAATAFSDAGRAEQADKERAEEEVLARYLPRRLTEPELVELVTVTLRERGLSSPKDFGPAMKAVVAAVAGRAEGGPISAEVRRQLAG